MMLAVTDPDHCHQCDTPTDVTQWAQPALLRHAGYGETTATTRRHCPLCGWSLITAIGAEAP